MNHSIRIGLMSERCVKLSDELKQLIQRYIDESPEDMNIEDIQSDLTGAILLNLTGVFEDYPGSDVMAFIVAGLHVLIKAKQERGDML
jgi:hypothetical protein